MSRPPLHVVFGAGQVGSRLAELLLSQGLRVRVAKRTRDGIPPGAEAILGDARDPGFCRSAAQGAVAIYHTLHPPYTVAAWREQLPMFARHGIAAAEATGARLVVLDNVYALGKPRDGIVRADASPAPASRKGRIRAEVADELLRAHADGRARVVIGRASDFYGPGGSLTYYGDQFWPDALAGRPVRTITPLDHPHTNHYIPDVAAGLAALGTADDDVTGRPWMLPCAPAITPRAMIDACAAALGRPIRVQPTPPWLQLVLSVGIPFLREAREMAYQWEAPFVMDDAPFRARFALEATPVSAGVAATVAWARRHYGARG